MSNERLINICQEVPRSVFYYLEFKYTNITLSNIEMETNKFTVDQKKDKAQKDEHLRLFRPNLDNPANKQATKELNEQELKRSEVMKDLIDETQVTLLNIEEDQSQMFFVAYLNNVRSLIKIFDYLLQKSSFIMLPGDEIVEKKHGNIKMLTAQMQSADLGKRKMRKWPGLSSLLSRLIMRSYSHNIKIQKPMTCHQHNQLLQQKKRSMKSSQRQKFKTQINTR